MPENKLLKSIDVERNKQGAWSTFDILILLPFVYIMISVPIQYVLRVFNYYIITNYTLETLKYSAINLILHFGILIMAVSITTYIAEKRPFLSLGLNGHHRLRKYIFGFYIGFMLMTIITFLIVFLGGGKVDPSFLEVSGVKAFPTIVIMLVGWIVQGAAEEIFARGFILPKLACRFNIPIAIALSASTFALIHLFNEGPNLIPLMNLVLFGIFASLYALYEGGIVGICALHSSWNFFQGNVYGFIVSGQAPKGGSLVGIIVSDKTMINGGSFGPEGGLIVTGILMIACLWFTYLLYRKEKLGIKKNLML